MNCTDSQAAPDETAVTTSDDYSRREFLLKVWFGLSVILTAIGLGLTLWGTVYHPAGYGGPAGGSSTTATTNRNNSPSSTTTVYSGSSSTTATSGSTQAPHDHGNMRSGGSSGGSIDSKTVVAGLMCLSFGAFALAIFCWYTKCCNTNGLPDCPSNNAHGQANGFSDGVFDDRDVPKHIPPPVPGLLITQTFGPVQPGTIANLTPPQIHKLASTPTDDPPPISAMATPRASFSIGHIPRSPRSSFSGQLPQGHSRIPGPIQSLPGLGSSIMLGGKQPPMSPVHSSPSRLSSFATGGGGCASSSGFAPGLLPPRSPVKPGTIANLTPPQIHKLATTPTDDPFIQFQLSPRSKDRYLSPNYHFGAPIASSRKGHSPSATDEGMYLSSHSRRSSYCSMKGEPT